jgi:hypothetical protein
MAVSPKEKRNPADIAADILAFPLDKPSGVPFDRNKAVDSEHTFEERLHTHYELAKENDEYPPGNPANAAVDKRGEDYGKLVKALYEIAAGETVTQQHKQIVQLAPELVTLLVEAARYDAGHAQDTAGAPDEHTASFIRGMGVLAKSLNLSEDSPAQRLRRFRKEKAHESAFDNRTARNMNEGVLPLVNELADTLGVKLEGRAPGK